MCGIIGVVSKSKESVVQSVLDGLLILSNRGYDSSGLVVHSANKGLQLYKRRGDLDVFIKNLPKVDGDSGIGHNRWASNGKVTDNNAHPHLSSDGSIVVVHNGIIENHEALRAMLKQKGFYFLSETDTEVIPNLIRLALNDGAQSLVKAVVDTTSQLVGEYAFLVMSRDYPSEIVAATYERPLILGVGEKNFSIASCEDALVSLADKVLFMEDHEIALITPNDITNYRKIGNELKVIERQYVNLSVNIGDVSKGDFSTFLESEIFQQPETVKQALRGRMGESGELQISGLKSETFDFLKSASSITAVACGTSYHALLVAKLYFERCANITLNVELASEFQDREPLIRAGSLLIAVSQSGETADTVRAMSYAKDRGAYVLAVANCMNSQLVNKAHDSISVQAGPEKSVASTKAYTAQVVTLFLLAIKAGVLNGTITSKKADDLFLALEVLPKQIEQVLRFSPEVGEVARAYRSAPRIIIIGKGYAVPVAYEGALKVQEVAYQDAFGFPSGELKHGPLALVMENVPVIVIALDGLASQRAVSNGEEVMARNGDIIAIVTAGSEEEKKFTGKAKYIFSLPQAIEEMTPILSVIIIQLLALYLGIERGSNVDKPRNLAKSVTVS